MMRLVPILAIVVAIIAAAAFGWWAGQPRPLQETRAPETRQRDGSVVLERRPDATAKPAHQLPKGAKLERVGRVTVQPARTGKDSLPVAADDPCPPVSVDWSLVREPDGGRRFLASSPDGTVLGGLDVPVESAALPPETKRWAAGVSWAPASETAGVWVERDVPLFSRALRIGVDVNHTRPQPDASGIEARLRVGMTF